METTDGNISDQIFDLPEEILIEILLKLPPESILRVRFVSKHWLSLISDPSFFPSYVSRSNGSTHPFTLVFHMHTCISIWSNFKNFTSYSLFPCDQIQGLEVEATCNDLILYRWNRHDRDLPVYFVVNPFTRQTVILPMHGRKGSCDGYTGLISCVEYGITNYNLSRNCDQNIKLTSLSIEAFSSLEGERREFRLRNSSFNVEVDKRPCIAFKGALHWICNKMKTLLAYDPCSSNPNQCRFISIPNEGYSINGMNAILGVSCDNLYYFEVSRISIEEFKLPGWKLWVMRDYEKGVWSLDKKGNDRRVYEPLSIIRNLLSSHSPLFPLAFHPWDNDIVYFWYEGYILSFNVETGWFEGTISRLSMVSMSEIFPLSMPLCPTQLPLPQWEWKNRRNGGQHKIKKRFFLG